MASNSSRTLNSVEMSCWDVASSRGHGPELETSVSWPFLLSDLTMKMTSYSHEASHISYVHTHTRLQNEMIYILVKNKINKTNSQET